MLQRNNIFLKYASFIALLFMLSNAQAQDEMQMTEAEAVEHIQQLQEGCLLVVLRTNHKRLANLNRALSKEGLSKRKIKYLNKNKAKTIEEDGYYNDALIAAMQSNYNFSDFAFTTDAYVDAWLDGSQSKLQLVDAQMNDTDATDCIADGNFYILEDGYTSGEMKFYALIFHDAQYNRLAPPFPYYINLSNAGPISLANGLLGKSDYRAFPEMIDRMQVKLSKRAAKLMKP